LELASDRIERARTLEPANGDYHYRASLTYAYWALTLDPAKYENATQAFSQAVAVSPHEIDIYNQWADFEVRSRNSDKALELLLTSLDVDPRWAPTYYHLSSVYRDLGRDDEAESAYQDSVELCPTMWPVCLELVRVLLSSAKLAEARPYAESYVAALPKDREGRLILASVYQGLGMTEEAQEQGTIALSLAPAPSQE